MLAELRDLLGDALPEMQGANRLGQPRPLALVLWEHPELLLGDGADARPMPVLALAEVGDGRSIALAVEGAHKLRFGRLGASAGGRAHGALFEGLLGWLMRDPRYEAARFEMPEVCVSGRPLHAVVTPLPSMTGPVVVTITSLSDTTSQPRSSWRITASARNEPDRPLPRSPLAKPPP